MSAAPDHGAALGELVGVPNGPPSLSPHPVNEPMIRHWIEAMGDANPAYVSAEAAAAAGLGGIIAPPTMLQAWIMRGLRATLDLEVARAAGSAAGDSPNDTMMRLLDEEGLTSVVATNCEQTYDRPLRPGDRLAYTSVIESISDIKETGLGTGRFVTTRTDFVAVRDSPVTNDPDLTPAQLSTLFGSGEPVATMRFRILKYRPLAGSPAQPAALRPRPALTEDIAFWFEGTRRGEILIQRCASCGVLRHPPLPACATCRSFEWDTVTASGRGEIFSFVVIHYPHVPGFDYPLAIGLIELEEGTRLMANISAADTSSLRIGQKVTATLVAHDDELTLPVFEVVGQPERGGSAG